MVKIFKFFHFFDGDQGCKKKPDPGWEKFRIRDKHPGSATRYLKRTRLGTGENFFILEARVSCLIIFFELCMVSQMGKISLNFLNFFIFIKLILYFKKMSVFPEFFLLFFNKKKRRIQCSFFITLQ